MDVRCAWHYTKPPHVHEQGQVSQANPISVTLVQFLVTTVNTLTAFAILEHEDIKKSSQTTLKFSEHTANLPPGRQRHLLAARPAALTVQPLLLEVVTQVGTLPAPCSVSTTDSTNLSEGSAQGAAREAGTQ